MKVTRNEMQAIRMALTTINRELRVTIEEMNELDSISGGKPIWWGVNWSAMGTQTATNALDYANAITRAVAVADGLNTLGLIEDWNLEESALYTLDSIRGAAFEIGLAIEKNMSGNGRAIAFEIGLTIEKQRTKDAVVMAENLRQIVHEMRDTTQE